MNPYLNQYFIFCGPPKYSKWSAHRKSLGTTDLQCCETTINYPLSNYLNGQFFIPSLYGTKVSNSENSMKICPMNKKEKGKEKKYYHSSCFCVKYDF